MTRIMRTIASLLLAAVVLAGVPSTGVEASYWGTYFDFSEQTVTVARGTSKTITMYTEYSYSIDVLNATSKGTAAYVVNRKYNRDIIELRVAADETSSRVRFMVYINDENHHDKSARDFIYVNVSNKSDQNAAAGKTTAAGAAAAITVSDNTDYWAFQQAITDAVTAAPANAAITINTGSWDSLYTTSLDAIAARTDVTITVNWVQDGVIKTFTLPAGTVTSTLRDENGFLGFEHLQRVFGD